LSRIGIRTAQKERLSEFYFYNVRRGENMDVYLHQHLHELDDIHLKKMDTIHGILFCCEKDIRKNHLLQSVVAGKKSIIKGEYAVVVL
jgi:hypothetical protein